MPQSQIDTAIQSANTDTQSAKQLKLSDYRRLLALTKDGDDYHGRCPSCDAETLSLSRRADGKLSLHCRNKCNYSDIKAAVHQLKREDLSSPADVDHAESPREVPEGAQITYLEMDADPDSSPDASWEWKTRQCEQAIDEDKIQALAETLGVGKEALSRLRVGWLPEESCYVFPELNADRQVVGICRRFKDGDKKTIQGSHRGLYVPANWDKNSGPIFLPEGASDVAAALTMDLCVIGRPSATGGTKLLCKLLKDVPKDREIIVLGEMDPSHTGKWVGLDAAKDLATALAGALGRCVHWALPPEGKDVREFLGQRSEGTTPIARRREFLDRIHKTAVEPGEARFRLEVVSAADLLKQKIDLEWAVTKLLVLGQPALIGGPQKALKTTLALDLAISLVSGRSFLNYKPFSVPKRLKVCVLSGESGKATIQRTIRDQLKAKDVRWKDKPDVVGDLHLGFTLPQFSVRESLTETEELLDEGRFDILIVDPLYLCLLAGNSIQTTAVREALSKVRNDVVREIELKAYGLDVFVSDNLIEGEVDNVQIDAEVGEFHVVEAKDGKATVSVPCTLKIEAEVSAMDPNSMWTDPDTGELKSVWQLRGGVDQEVERDATMEVTYDADNTDFVAVKKTRFEEGAIELEVDEDQLSCSDEDEFEELDGPDEPEAE